MVGIKKLDCLGVLSRKTSKTPQKDESYQEGFRTDPYFPAKITRKNYKVDPPLSRTCQSWPPPEHHVMEILKNLSFFSLCHCR